jgi:hypothetical protein
MVRYRLAAYHVQVASQFDYPAFFYVFLSPSHQILLGSNHINSHIYYIDNSRASLRCRYLLTRQTRKGIGDMAIQSCTPLRASV